MLLLLSWWLRSLLLLLALLRRSLGGIGAASGDPTSFGYIIVAIGRAGVSGDGRFKAVAELLHVLVEGTQESWLRPLPLSWSRWLLLTLLLSFLTLWWFRA